MPDIKISIIVPVYNSEKYLPETAQSILKHIALKYLKSEPAKKRYTTWLILRLRKIGLDRLLFFLVSRI